MKRRLAVADIHGEAERLLKVLELANYNSTRDQLFLLGDYIDRGLEPARTVDMVHDLVSDGAIALLGNHDHAWVHCHITGIDDFNWRQKGHETTLHDFGEHPPGDVLNFLGNLPLYHEEPDCILVHAGLVPGVPLEQQSLHAVLWIRSEFHRGYTGKRVIFGHTPTWILHEKWEPWYGKDKVGIDTGAVWGGVLTLFDLDNLDTWTA